jgi:hypothetical protein
LGRPEKAKGESEVLSATQIGVPGGVPMPLPIYLAEADGLDFRLIEKF